MRQNHEMLAYEQHVFFNVWSSMYEYLHIIDDESTQYDDSFTINICTIHKFKNSYPSFYMRLKGKLRF